MTTVVERHTGVGLESVRTRISWGAILAGAAVALAIYALLTALGVAVGLSVSDDVNERTLGTGAGVWGFISLLVALFLGGWVTTQVTSGENRTEAMLYGVVLWATVSVLLLWLAANGLRAGLNTALMAQSSNAVSMDTTQVDQTPEQRQAALERAREAGRTGSWWAFAGMLLSMAAAIGGAMVGPVELTVRRDTRSYRGEDRTVVT